MITKVLIGSAEDVRYHLKQSFPGIKKVDARDLSEDGLASKHQKNLFSKESDLTCFTNLDKQPLESLLNLVDKVAIDVIWCFNSLAKNTKLYKKLSSTTTVEECSGLEGHAEKKKFIKEMLVKYNVPKTFESRISFCTSEDRFIIESEIQKLSEAYKILGSYDFADQIISVYNSNVDTLEFVSALLSGNTQAAYKYADKIASEHHALQINSVLRRKINFLIHLSLNDVEGAVKIWRAQGYFLEQDKKLAKKLGTEYLLNLFSLVDQVLGNVMEKKDLFTRLCGIIFFHLRHLESH